MSMRYSKLQLSVFSLYKRLIRASEGRPGFKEHVQKEFRKNAMIPRTNILQIEYLLRKGEKQVKNLQNTGIQSMRFIRK